MVCKRTPSTTFCAETKALAFFSKVAVSAPDKCWMWKAYRNPSGYGTFWDAARARSIHAQRVAWELSTGETQPKGMCVRHLCHNPGCVNPRHLALGTPKDNAMDSVAVGKHVHGDRSGNRVLSSDLVRQMRARVAAGERLQTLATEFGSNYHTIYQAIRGANWKYVEGAVSLPRSGYRVHRPSRYSKYKGVSRFLGRHGKLYSKPWQTGIYVDKKRIALGVFKLEEEAAMTYDDAHEKYFGTRPNEHLLRPFRIKQQEAAE